MVDHMPSSSGTLEICAAQYLRMVASWREDGKLDQLKLLIKHLAGEDLCEMVDDLLQDTILTTARKMEEQRYNPALGDPFSYTIGIARNTVRSQRTSLHRRNQRERRFSEIEDCDGPDDTEEHQIRRTEFADQNSKSVEQIVEEQNLLEEARQHTSPLEWQTLQAANQDGLSGKEVAEKMHMSHNAVRTAIHRAQRRLRKHFQK